MRSHEWGIHPIRRRFMDPSTGRFTTLDSFAGDMQDPLSLNKYLYTQADPINGADPSGCDDIGGARLDKHRRCARCWQPVVEGHRFLRHFHAGSLRVIAQ